MLGPPQQAIITTLHTKSRISSKIGKDYQLTCQSHQINVNYSNQATYLQRHEGAGKSPAARRRAFARRHAAQYMAKKRDFWSKILHTFACFHDTTSCARSAHIQTQCCQKMTACNKKIFPCKGTFSAITLERLVRWRQNLQRFLQLQREFTVHFKTIDAYLGKNPYASIYTT